MHMYLPIQAASQTFGAARSAVQQDRDSGVARLDLISGSGAGDAQQQLRQDTRSFGPVLTSVRAQA